MNRARCVSAAMAGLVAALLSITGPAALAAEGEQTPPPASSEAAVRQYSDAAALYNRMVYDLAADEWGKFLEKFPNDPLAPKARHYLGICLLEQKKYDQARKTLEALVAENPKF